MPLALGAAALLAALAAGCAQPPGAGREAAPAAPPSSAPDASPARPAAPAAEPPSAPDGSPARAAVPAGAPDPATGATPSGVPPGAGALPAATGPAAVARDPGARSAVAPATVPGPDPVAAGAPPAATSSTPGGTSPPAAPGPAPAAASGGAPRADPAAAPLPVRLAEARSPGGPVPLSPDDTTPIPAAAAFEVSVGARLAEARLQLLDARDAAVAASGTTLVDGETRFTLEPDEPLRPGAYVLRLEGLRSAAPRSADGSAFAPAAWRVTVAGTPSPAPARRKAKRPARDAPPAE